MLNKNTYFAKRKGELFYMRVPNSLWPILGIFILYSTLTLMTVDILSICKTSFNLTKHFLCLNNLFSRTPKYVWPTQNL